MRVVSICPSNTELMGYLGKEDLLVGIDDYSDWPASITHLPRVGPDLNIDMEKVARLKPDLVLASLSVPGMEKNIDALKQYDLPYIVLNPNSLAEIGENLRRVATAIGYKSLGEQTSQQFLDEISSYRNQRSSNKEKPTLYWEWWPKPIFTPGKKNWLTEISELAGAENIFSTENTASFKTDWEDVKKRNPDHICMVWVGVKEEKMNPDLVRNRPGWEQMNAIEKDRIHVLEESLYCRPSPRLLEGLEKLVKTIYKET